MSGEPPDDSSPHQANYSQPLTLAEAAWGRDRLWVGPVKIADFWPKLMFGIICLTEIPNTNIISIFHMNTEVHSE